MFKGGLSQALVNNLKLIIKFVPSVRTAAHSLLLREISTILSSKANSLDEAKLKRPLDSTTKSTRDKQKWNSASSTVYNPQISKLETDNLSKDEEDLIFALQVLSEPEFFPKQHREKV